MLVSISVNYESCDIFPSFLYNNNNNNNRSLNRVTPSVAGLVSTGTLYNKNKESMYKLYISIKTNYFKKIPLTC